MPTRKNPSSKQRDRIFALNANRCCVCKRAEIGLQLHHIDGDRSNTTDKNLALLCVEDHDHHHRPKQYTKTNHQNLTAAKLLEYKTSWESFVCDAQSTSPSVAAVINIFGSYEQIHAAKIIFQWPDEKIEFERTFHLLEGNIDYWTDEMISEVHKIGKNVKLVLVDEPLPIEYCDCCGKGYSHTVKEGLIAKLNDPNWKTHSLISVYINPTSPSLAITVGLPEKILFSGSIHLCQGKYLHLTSNYYDERVDIKTDLSIRAQVTDLVSAVISTWEPSHLLFGTGDHDNPELIEDFILPKVWETGF